MQSLKLPDVYQSSPRFDYTLVAMGVYSDGSVTLKQVNQSLAAIVHAFPSFDQDRFWDALVLIMARELEEA